MWLSDARPHRRGTEVDVQIEVFLENDDPAVLAWRETFTFLCFHATSKGVDKDKNASADSTKTGAIKEDMKTSDGAQQLMLHNDDGFRYAAICADYNPIHLWAWSAKLFGFRQPIQHGMLLAERCLPFVLQRLQGTVQPVFSNCVEGSLCWSVTFRKPMYVPGTATPHCQDTQEHDNSGVSFRVFTDTGKCAQQGSVFVPASP